MTARHGFAHAKRWTRAYDSDDRELLAPNAVGLGMTSTPGRTLPFFVLTFAITWGLQVPGVLALSGALPGDPKLYLPFAGLGLLGPAVAALALTRRESGWEGVRALLAPLRRWRMHPGWYLAALFPAAALSGLLFVLNLAGRHGPIAYVPPAGGLVFGAIVSVVEELGWRGYALPRLEKRWGGFAASALIGVVWYAWHLPMFAAAGVSLKLAPVMLLYFVGASLLLTWLVEGTGGSLLIAVVAHWGAHLDNSHRALPNEVLPLLVHAMVYAAFGLVAMRSSVTLPARSRAAASRRPST
jgi:membrane protease YdiL (CAAX protease family)